MPIYKQLTPAHRILKIYKNFHAVVSAFKIRFQRALTGPYNLFQTQIMEILLFLYQHAHIWKTGKFPPN